jgi:PAS domain S-box-containing protein
MPREPRKDDPADAARDPQRLAEVRASGLLDTPAEPKFDRWTAFVRKALGCDVSLLTLLDRDRQFFQSASGLDEPWASRRETPLSHSFCQYVVACGEPVRVADARSDPALSGNAAIADIGVIAYLGVPLRSASGRLLGSISAIQRDARQWTDRDAELLLDAAAAVEAEIELGTLQGWLQAVTTNLTDLITVFDAEGTLLYLSPSLSRILGRRAEDCVGGNVGDLVHPEDREELVDARRRVRDRPGSTSSVTFRVFRADGGQRFMEARLTNLLENPAVKGILTVIRDVTGRKEAERRLNLFLKHTPMGFWIVDSEFRFVWVAGMALEELNLDAEVLLGTTIFDLFGTDDAESIEIAAYRGAMAGRHEQFEVNWSDRWWEVRLAPIPDTGEGQRVVGVALDITDRKTVAARLEERTAHFQRLFEEAPEAITLVDREDRILQVNPEFERLFGYTFEEAVGRQINRLIVDPGRAEEAAEISPRRRWRTARSGDGPTAEGRVGSGRIDPGDSCPRARW